MRKVVVIVGPTATGKTSLAMKLCQKLDGEVVSVDSRQAYLEMEIGTGKKAQNIKTRTERFTNLAVLYHTRFYSRKTIARITFSRTGL